MAMILIALIAIIMAILSWCTIYFYAEKNKREKINNKEINKNKKKKIIVKDL